MTGAVLAVLLSVLVGLPVARLIDRRQSHEMLLGSSYLLGIAILSFGLLVLSLLQIRWSMIVFLSSTALVAVVLWIASLRFVPSRREESDRNPSGHPARVADLLTVAILVGYARFATTASLPEFDFISNWGLKARIFWEFGGVDWHFLETATYRSTHADYPLLVPLSFDVVALLNNRWDDQWIGLLYAAFGAALLLIIRGLIRRDGWGEWMVSLTSLALAALALSPWVGLGEGPLVAYAAAAIFCLRDGLNNKRRESLLLGGVFLGIASLVKNEGLALIVSVGLALIVIRRFAALRSVVVASAIALPWLILRSVYDLATDLATGAVVPRLAKQAANAGELMQAIASYDVGKPLFWIGVCAALAFCARRAIKTEAFVLVVLLNQVGSYIFAYLATPHEIDWHVRWSWERLVSHVAFPFGLLAILLLRSLIFSDSVKQEAERA